MKKLFRIAALLLVALLVAGWLCACRKQETETPLAVRGDLYVKDGITQNTHVYMENVYYKDGAVYYTLANLRSFRYTHASAPYVERWNGEEWVPAALYRMRFDALEGQPAYSTHDHSFRIDTDYAVAGKYRLIFGNLKNSSQDENGRYRYVYDPQQFYVIGYLDIPESEEIPAKRESELAFDAALIDGADGVYLRLRLENRSKAPFDVPLKQGHPFIEYYKKNETRAWFESLWFYFQYLEDTRVDPGQTLSLTIPVYEGKYDEKPIASLDPGRYCVRIFCQGTYSGREYYVSSYFDYPAVQEGGESA